MAYDKVLQALQETSRRKILLQLRAGPKSVAAIRTGMEELRIPRSRPVVSRPAISQHLKVLLQAELISFRVEGTRHIYRLRREGFEELQDWVVQTLKSPGLE
jgi:DNA-binding transcriptional ArsR family regulator